MTEKQLKEVLFVDFEDGDSRIEFPYELFVEECDKWLREGNRVAVFSDGESLEIKPASEVEP